jgi:membrane-bound lytic murein transglycosylase D
VTEKAIRDLNPELKRWCTPPASDEAPYSLRIPAGTKEQFVAEFKRIPRKQRFTYRVHKVKRGETLSEIARRYNSPAEAILEINQLKSSKSLKVNAELVVPVPRKGEANFREDPFDRHAAKAREPVAKKAPAVKAVEGRTRIVYEVMPGDTLWSLAERFKVTLEELRKWNEISERKRSLKAGTMIQVFTSNSPSEPRASGDSRVLTSVVARKSDSAHRPASRRTHLLTDGETLWSVSRRYNVSVEELKQWNGINDHRAVRVGQQLVVAPR